MKKLKLDNLKVKSFVTALEGEKAHTIKGGADNQQSVDICWYTRSGCAQTDDYFCENSGIEGCETKLAECM
jgi:hypothetical protein